VRDDSSTKQTEIKNIARHKGAIGYGICGSAYIFWLFWTIGNAKIVTI